MANKYKEQSEATIQRSEAENVFVLCYLLKTTTRNFGLGSLRSGNSNPITFAKPFSKECITKLPKSIKRIRIRADASFYDGKFIEFLDE